MLAPWARGTVVERFPRNRIALWMRAAASCRPEPPAPPTPPPLPSIWTAPTARLSGGLASSALAIGWQEGDEGGQGLLLLGGEEQRMGDPQPPTFREASSSGAGQGLGLSGLSEGEGGSAGTMKEALG